MQIAFTFRAKQGREEDLAEAMCDRELAARLARSLGATRSTLFLGGGQVVRVLEFPESVTPPLLPELVRKEPEYVAWLRRIAPLVENGPDVDNLHSLQAFHQRTTVPLAMEVRP